MSEPSPINTDGSGAIAGIGRSMAFVGISIALNKLKAVKPNNRQAARDAVDLYAGLIALRK